MRYWFNCVDVDGDSKLNNMEMRSFYAVQLHRMQCMGHEIVPFEDMLCQMMDMIKPKNSDHLVVEDFMQAECSQVSGALFDALFNLNKYLLFEQRDPFLVRQKREDEFDTDWEPPPLPKGAPAAGQDLKSYPPRGYPSVLPRP